jgi:hypothetical protein
MQSHFNSKKMERKMAEKKIKQICLDGRVASILNAKEIAINLGSIHGVEIGMIFAVLAESPLEIRDPSTGEILDRIDREKVRVKVTEVREKISIFSTFRILQGFDFAGLQSYRLLSEMLAQPKPETLKIEESSTPPPLPEEQSFVKINDRVRTVVS